MTRNLLLLSALGLCGCGVLSPIIRSDVILDAHIIEQTADRFLLINILEARDNAPLHFMEFPKMTGAFSASASLQASLPLHAERINKPSGEFLNQSVTPTVTVQSSPTFEVDHLDTKEFITGMTSAVDARYIKYLIDRGIDKRLVLLLFFSAATIESESANPSEKPIAITVRNDPRYAAQRILDCNKRHATEANSPMDCHARTQFELYLKLVDAIEQRFTTNLYTTRTLVAEGSSPTLKDASGIDFTKYQIERSGGPSHETYKLYATSSVSNVVLCVDRQNTSREGELYEEGNVCADPVITIHKLRPQRTSVTPLDFGHAELLSAPCTTASVSDVYCAALIQATTHWKTGNDNARSYKLNLTVRTAAEIVRYVGDVLYYEQTLRRDPNRIVPDPHHNVPLTVGFSESCHRDPLKDCVHEDGGYLFRLNGDGPARFSVDYGGENYAISQDDADDHSLEVLSILSFLIGLNKSAADIRTSSVIQLVP